jgi:hypothetical protein
MTTPSTRSSQSRLKALLGSFWFVPLVLLVAACIYYAPALSMDKVIQGTDDGARGWQNTAGTVHYWMESYWDRWSPLNGGTVAMEQRFGKFINPTFPLYLVLPKYQARVFEYLFWTLIGGLSMFFLARQHKVSRGVSLMTALGFMFAPALQSYVFAGHFARMEVVALMPAMLFFTEQLLMRFSLIAIAVLPAILALAIYSEHLQLAYFALLGIGIYFAARMIHQTFFKKCVSLGEGSKRSAGFAVALLLGALLTSMNTIPAMHHTDTTSKRAGGVDYEYASSFSAHPEEIVSLIQPDFVGWKEHYWGQNMLKFNSEYFGIIFVLAAVALFIIRGKSFERILLASFAIVALLFALGAHTPVHWLAYKFLPGIKSFRAPGMMYVWAFVPTLLLGAMALEELLALEWSKLTTALRKRLRMAASICAGAFALYLIASAGFAKFWYDTFYPLQMRDGQKEQTLTNYLGSIQVGGFLVFVAVSAFLVLFYLKMHGKIKRQTVLITLTVILCFDLVRISYPFFSQTLRPHNFFAGQERGEKSIGEFLQRYDNSLYRVHSMLGDMKMYIPGVDLTYVFDDFTDKNYNEVSDIMRSTDNALQQPQYASHEGLGLRFRNVLSLINAKYILALQELNIVGLTPIVRQGQLVIYRNETALPFFYLGTPEFVADMRETILGRLDAPQSLASTVVVDTSLTLSTNAITDSTQKDSVLVQDFKSLRQGRVSLKVRSSREQLLVMSQNYNPEWRARVNGKETTTLRANYLWNAVVVPAGESVVEFEYNSPVAQKWRSVTLYSALFYGVFVLAVLGIALMRKKQTAVKAEH